AVLAERLPVVAALDAMQHDMAAHVGAVEQVAVPVEVQAPRVAAALAEQLEAMRQRVVTPHALLKLDGRLLGGGRVPDPRRDRAALTAVEPTIRAPGERV